jgi:hypothetical protein
MPNNKLPDAPTLGNGYAGVMLADGPADGLNASAQSTDLWINTNALWSCDNNTAKGIPGRLTEAVCKRAGLGGVTISSKAIGMTGVAFYAEQRTATAHIYTKQTKLATNATIETVTFMHPEANIIITNITAFGVKAGSMLDVVVWVYDTSGRNTSTGSDATGGHHLWASRDVSTSLDPAIKHIRTALTVDLGQKFTLLDSVASTPAFIPRSAIGGSIPLINGATISIVTAVADNMVEGNNHDPIPSAKALTKSHSPTEVQSAAASYWGAYWARSSIQLPSSQAVQDFWYGAQYATACMTSTDKVLASTNGLLPPSGLYGPWVTGDGPAWNGDFTLDYNQEAQYYGVFSSNHQELAAAYFPPITAWMPAARQSAQAHAIKGNITCPAKALHYSCHLAPWGYQSVDQSEYMHWNGNFGALLFINHYEYTRDLVSGLQVQ